ncbi:MAG: spondin domain-containing protein, partial [Gammaproteobacteria bacterium]
MQTLNKLLMRTALLAVAAASSLAHADDGLRFEVTVTNLTRGQQFTPILVATHREGVSLFKAGDAASPQLAILAEEGDTAPLTSLLSGLPEVKEVVSSSGLLDPGDSVTITVETGGPFDHLSVAAMLIPTNDGFFAINGVAGPNGNDLLRRDSPAYDVGSERNDELCASIPGPEFAECGGPGGGGKPEGDEEGYVHIHAGIHGIGDLPPEVRDWRN